MGTRNLTMVMADGVYKIAQYGQWDGHPSGQGVTALEFCRQHLATTEGRGAFRKQLDLVHFLTEAEYDARVASADVDPKKPYLTMEEVRRIERVIPYASRDVAADILSVVMGAARTVETKDRASFAGDSLMCEWAYVIDLDKGTFEAFKGFNTNPLPATDRFANIKDDSEESLKSCGTAYYAVRLTKSYSLDELPSQDAFEAEADPPEEEDVAAKLEENVGA